MANNTSEKSVMTLRLPEDLDAWLKQESKGFGISKTSMIVMLLQDYRVNKAKSQNG